MLARWHCWLDDVLALCIMYVRMYVCMCMYVCVCMCVCVFGVACWPAEPSALFCPALARFFIGVRYHNVSVCRVCSTKCRFVCCLRFRGYMYVCV
ncbi:MAG TPA: hypothetical protein V6C97_01320 [Oculatellaceae cyanobacterium]